MKYNSWMGEIPNNWKTESFRRLFQIKKQIAGKLGYDILSVTQQGLKVKDITKNEGQLAMDYSKYQLVSPNDFVMNHMDLLTGYIDLSKQVGVTSPDYRTFKSIRTDLNLEYYLRIFQFCYADAIFYKLGQGVSNFGRWRLPADQQNRFELPLPPLNEQNKIVSFLNKKCGEIDELMDLETQMIDELKAYKQTIITEAVTRGLNPNVPMRNSGIEWIGEIPIEYKFLRIKNVIAKYKAGPFGSSLITGNLLNSGNILVYTPEHIAKGTTNIDGNLYLPQERLQDMVQFCVNSGDVIFPIVGSLGRAMVVTPEMPAGIINQRLAKFQVNKALLRLDYFMYVFSKSSFYTPYIAQYNRGSFIVNLTKTLVEDMPLVLPPLNEQQEIVKYLDSKCADIDALIALRQEKIDTLKEYKKSLIFEYVTGKKQVV